MKNKKTYAIFLLTFMTSLLLTVSSYAWFSTNRILGFHSFNIHIASKGGIEISSDAVNWKGVLALVDLIEARKFYPTSVNQIPFSLVPVSTGGDIENGFLKLYHGEVMQNANSTTLVADRRIETEGFGIDSNGSFVAFDMFFKNISEKTLYLTGSSSVSQTGENSGIENAFRIAFLNQGTLPTTSSVSNIQRQSGASKAYIWEPNYDIHKESAVNHALTTYGISTSPFNAERLSYNGIISDITKGDNVLVNAANSINYPNKFKQVNIDIPTRFNFNNNQKIFTINPGVSKVRVYIWIEGQDVDCEDNSSIGDVIIDIQLSTDPS